MEIEQGTLFETDVSSALPTFDQIVRKYDGDVAGVDIGPNYRQDAELVIEPVSGGLNVTVRDADHNTLISFIVGRGEASDMTAQVAMLRGMRALIKDRLSRTGSEVREIAKETAIEAIDAFKRDVVDSLRKSVATKSKDDSFATRIRAAAAIDSLRDARKIIEDRMVAARAAGNDLAK